MAGRPLSKLDPAGGPLVVFARELRALRVRAGEPTLEAMARRSGMSRSVFSEALAGRRLPTEAVLAAFVRQCQGSEEDVKAWLTWRAQLRGAGQAAPGLASIRPAPSRPGAQPDSPQAWLSTDARPRHPWRAAALAACTMILALAGLGMTDLLGRGESARHAQHPGRAGAAWQEPRPPAEPSDGADPGAAGCTQDASSAGSVMQGDGSRLTLWWSDRCQANWGEIAVPGALARNDPITVTLTATFPGAKSPQAATATGASVAHTTIMLAAPGQVTCVTGGLVASSLGPASREPVCG